jgi:hypothetical protein
MGQPRFLFMSGVARTPDVLPGLGELWFAWRMVGANNRPMARSTSLFPSAATCREAVAELQSAQLEQGLTLVADPVHGTWSWTFAVGSRTKACSGRSYHRQRECRYNANAFVDAVPLAVFGANVLLLPTQPVCIDLVESPGTQRRSMGRVDSSAVVYR